MTAGRHVMVIAAVLAAPVRAVAEPPAGDGAPSATLRWSAPAGCPDETALRARVDARLPKPLGPGDAIDATVTVRRERKTLRAQVRVWTPAADAERELVAARCDELADAVAVVLARAVAEARAQIVTDDAAALLAINVEPLKPLEPVEGCQPGLDDDCPSTRPRSREGSLRVKRPVEPSWDGGLRPAMVSGAGIGPHVGFGLELGLWLRKGSFAGEVVGTRWLDRLAELPASTRFGAQIGLDALAGRACWSPDRFGPRVCLLGEMGNMSGRGVGLFDARVGEARYSALGLGVSLRAKIRPHVALVGGFDMLSAIDRPRFVLDRGTLLHQPEALAGRVGFGCELGWY